MGGNDGDAAIFGDDAAVVVFGGGVISITIGLTCGGGLGGGATASGTGAAGGSITGLSTGPSRLRGGDAALAVSL